MMIDKTHASDLITESATETTVKNLRVLIVGGPEALEDSSQILDSLLTIGYAVTLLGILDWATKLIHRTNGTSLHELAMQAFSELMTKDTPDLLIITSDDDYVRKSITSVAPEHTRVLDSFALEILQAHKRVTGQLDSTVSRLETVELMKEVLMDDTEISIMVVDEDLNVQEINNSLLKKAAMSKQDCLSRPCHWVMKHYMECCEKKGEFCLAQEVLRSGRPVHTVREEKDPGKQMEYYMVSAYPLRQNEQGKKSVMMVWKDITPGMTSVLDRQARNMRADFSHLLHQDKMIALGKLAAAAVHEINNPIQGILTFAKLMRNSLNAESISDSDLDKFRTYLDLIANESSRCGQILRNLLSFSRQNELKSSSIRLTGLLDELELLLGNRMDLQGITLYKNVPENLDPILGDRDQLKQVLLNILLNAVESMADGGTISIRADQHIVDGFMRIQIQDSGIGIPHNVQDKVFEPFFSTKTESKGVGLGLSVVYGIIAQHGGTIEFESEEGTGTTVIITLPTVKSRSDEFES